MSLDLHTHSTRSDGTTSPGTNVALAAAAGLTGLALTDHDTTAGLHEAAGACAFAGLEFVPGIELSAELDALSVHLLGYWFDPADVALVAECERLRTERSERAAKIVVRLRELGVAIDLDRVRDRAGDAPVGRPHIAAEMVALGAVPDIDTAFSAFLADGGPAHVPKHALAPVDAVRLIRAAGGAVVLAHPGAGERQAPVTPALVAELAAAGLGGLELEHPAHDPEAVAYWRGVALELDLVTTGASDFHGDNKDVKIGAQTTGKDAVEALRERRGPSDPLRTADRHSIATVGFEEESDPW